mmetsp:Transcript_153449/g.282733  ORF Transcript_153449/g.282733 Transcript_153449/m.282733 type:complete len:430 (-) Transcript_153449:140-1429(-)
MSNHSKELADAETMSKTERRKRIRCLMLHIFANVTIFCMPIQAGPKVVADLCNGDHSKGAKFLGLCSAGSAAIEFLINPTLGCWSDAHGRRFCFLLGPIGSIFTSTIYALLPQSLPLIAFVRVVGNSMNGMSGSTSTLTALTDVCCGDTTVMTQAAAAFNAWANMGVVVGPVIGGIILDCWGDRSLYAVKAVLSFLHAVMVCKYMPETLALDHRRPFNRRYVSPFSFFKLFRTTPMLTALTVCNTFSLLNDGKCVSDLNQLWMRANLKWSVRQSASWTVGAGLSGMVAGAFIADPIIRNLGARGAQSFGALFGIIGYAVTGFFSKGWAYWTGLLLRMGCVGEGVLKAAATKHAVNAGMGAGQYQGQLMNLRALVFVFGPLFFTQLYARQVAKGGLPGASYILVGLLSWLVPELMHQTWSNDQVLTSRSG